MSFTGQGGAGLGAWQPNVLEPRTGPKLWRNISRKSTLADLNLLFSRSTIKS